MGGSDSSGTSRSLTASWFPDHVDRSTFRHLAVSSSQTSFKRHFANVHNMNSHHSILPPLLFCQWGEDPICTSFSDTKMIVQCGHVRCRSDDKTFLNPSNGDPLFGPDYYFVSRCLDVCNRNSSHCNDVPNRCSSSKLRLPRLNSPQQKKTWVLRRAFLPKHCFRFSKDFFGYKPFVVVIEHHDTKIKSFFRHFHLKSCLESSIFQKQTIEG